MSTAAWRTASTIHQFTFQTEWGAFQLTSSRTLTARGVASTIRQVNKSKAKHKTELNKHNLNTIVDAGPLTCKITQSRTH